MPLPTRGYSDSYHQSRINHLSGTSYPAALTTPYIGLYLGKLPLSDGSGNTDTVRVAVTWGSATQDPNTQRWYIQPNASLSFAIPGGTTGQVVGWGVYGAASGGSPAYVDEVPSPFQVMGGTTVTLGASTFRAWAEGTVTQQ